MSEAAEAWRGAAGCGLSLVGPPVQGSGSVVMGVGWRRAGGRQRWYTVAAACCSSSSLVSVANRWRQFDERGGEDVFAHDRRATESSTTAGGWRAFLPASPPPPPRGVLAGAFPGCPGTEAPVGPAVDRSARTGYSTHS